MRRFQWTAIALAGALSVTACAGSGSPPARSDAPTQAGPESSWDPASWVPTEKIEPRMTDEAEREQWYQEKIATDARALGLDDVPDVDRRGWATSATEHEKWVADCMTDRGVPTTWNGPALGGIQYDTPPESQKQAVALVEWTCSAMYPIDPTLLQDWTDAQLRLVYDYWEQYEIPCLEARGFTVDTSARPSKESFVAKFHTQERHRWWPVQDTLVGLDDARYADVIEACPEFPSDAVLYGYDG